MLSETTYTNETLICDHSPIWLIYIRHSIGILPLTFDETRELEGLPLTSYTR